MTVTPGLATTNGDAGVAGDAPGVSVPGRISTTPDGAGDTPGDEISAAADGLPVDAVAALVSVAGGATTRGVSVELGDAAISLVGDADTNAGVPLLAGDAARVASRSVATCVRALGAIVITSSVGCELERVKTKASRRLANSAPAAISAFVRFNESSRFRGRRLPILVNGSGQTCRFLDYLHANMAILPPAAENLRRIYREALDKPHGFSMLASDSAMRTYDYSNRSCMLNRHRSFRARWSSEQLITSGVVVSCRCADRRNLAIALDRSRFPANG